MAEDLKTEQKGYKIWKHPLGGDRYIAYMGEFYPPAPQFFFFPGDLKALGFGPGRYSVLAPESGLYRTLLKRWQSVVVEE